ncbi:MAG: OmpH family outer membrane protein [Alphaproteobacteria bacterium]|nr:OmpH family outer membrane protein [Alphaproteobacteria bacterium]
MRNKRTAIAIGISAGCLALLFYGFYSAFSVYKSTLKRQGAFVAVIDSPRIKNEAEPFVKVGNLLKEQHTQSHKEILAQETSLRKQMEEIKKGKLSSEDRQKRKIQFDKKVAELEQHVRQKQEKLNKQFGALMERVETSLYDIISMIAREKGVNLVLNSNIQGTEAVLYVDDFLDITDETIKRLNKKLEKITLPELE